MLTIPNILSLLRLPLAFAFLKEDTYFRVFVIFCAMVSDVLDGFLARRYRLSTPFGALLDPLTDRFFVLFIIGVILVQGQLTAWQAATMLVRDFAIFFFGWYLFLTGKLSTYRFRAILCGKVTTSLQFLVLLAITVGYVIPQIVFNGFIFIGICALFELYTSQKFIAETTPAE